MADLTLNDLVSWDERLQVDPANPLACDDRELTWAVTARASAPMLPLLRGGEVVLLPARVTQDTGISLPILLRELAQHNVVGAILEASPGPNAPLPVILVGQLPLDFESDINRLLTQRRGELYRAGTDLSRTLATLAAANADLPDLLAAIRAHLGCDAVVSDRRGTLLAAAAASAGVPKATDSAKGWNGAFLAIPLSGGETLWLGPVAPGERAMVRVAGERAAVAVESALVRVAQDRPRGPARASALAALLAADPDQAARAAASVGLSADGSYRIMLASADMDFPWFQRQGGALGMLHEAGSFEDWRVYLVEGRIDPPARTVTTRSSVRQPQRDGAFTNPPQGRIAASSSVSQVRQLPAAAREARYVAALMDAGLLPGNSVRFDRIDDLGPYRLLYPLWGSDDLQDFAASALGSLADRDRRGTLRDTLLAYLNAGGSHVDAANALGIHRNTLAYRLRQIAEATGRDPDAAEHRLVLHLALLAASLPQPEERSTLR